MLMRQVFSLWRAPEFVIVAADFSLFFVPTALISSSRVPGYCLLLLVEVAVSGSDGS